MKQEVYRVVDHHPDDDRAEAHERHVHVNPGHPHQAEGDEYREDVGQHTEEAEPEGTEREAHDHAHDQQGRQKALALAIREEVVHGLRPVEVPRHAHLDRVPEHAPREGGDVLGQAAHVPGAEGAGLGGQAGHAAVEAHQLVQLAPVGHFVQQQILGDGGIVPVGKRIGRLVPAMHGLVDFLDDIEDADRFGDQRRYIEVLLEALKPAQERLRLHPVLPPGVEHDLDGHGTAHAFIHKVVGLPQREGLREHPGRARLHLNQGVSVDGHPEQHHKQRQQYFGIPDIDQVDPAEETVEDVRRSDPDRR